MRHRAFLAATAAILVLILVGQTAICLAAGGDMGAGTEPLTDGSAGYPYLIEDLPDFDVFAGNSSYWASDVHTTLACDPNLAGRTYTTAVIAPDTDDLSDGFQGTSFNGVFNGDGHVISNLIIDAASWGSDYLGLFGQIDVAAAEIKNLGIVNCNITGRGGSSYLGILCGVNWYGEITNCYSTGSVSANHSRHGGLCGANWYGEITNCYSTGSVSGTFSLGGLCGRNAGTITNSYATGVVTGKGGGLCGDNYGTISNCYATGAVNGDGGNYLGGLCGTNAGPITNSYATGAITGADYLGGLCGWNREGGTIGTITNCYATGSVTGDDYLGGLCGNNSDGGTITTCYAVGAITGSSFLGGLCGYQIGWNNSKITNSFWDTDTSGMVVGYNLNPSLPGTVTNVVGKTTSEMQDANTFLGAGWDFVTVWAMLSGGSYPFLLWEMPYIGLSTDEYIFTANLGGSAPADQTLIVFNATGTDVLNWQITESCPWLSASPLTGSSTGDLNTVTLSVDHSGLSPGYYQCILTVSDAGASNNPQTVDVLLYVAAGVLTAHWPFDSDANDIEGGYDGTFANGAAITNVPFEYRIGTGAVTFDDINDYVSTPYAGVPGSAARTCAAWVKVDTGTTSWSPIIHWGNGAGGGSDTNGGIDGQSWVMSIRDPASGGYLDCGVDGGNITGNTNIIDGQWHHVAAVLPAGGTKTDDIKLYVDGIYDGSSALTSYDINTSADTGVLIGKNRDWGGIFAGQIDDVRVYDRELTDAEILALASEAVPVYEPMIGLSASEFNFFAALGGPNPTDQVLTIQNTGGQSLIWQIDEDCDWLTVTPLTGSSAGDPNVILSIDVTGLAPNNYSCDLTISDPLAYNNPQTVTVNLTVGAVIELSKTSLSFESVEFGPNPADQTFAISNVGGGTLNWDIDEDCDWLTVSPVSGSAGESNTVTLSVDATSLAVGDYNCQLTVSDVNASNSPQTVDVTLNKSDTCIPSCHPDYDEWISVGMPESWCAPEWESGSWQCKGDTDGMHEGGFFDGYYYVGGIDLGLLFEAWKVKEPPFGPGIDTVSYDGWHLIPGIAADFDHRAAGSPYTGYYRVGATDGCVLAKYWLVKHHNNPAMEPDCLECASGGAGMEGPNLHLRIDTGGGFYDPGASIILDPSQIVTIGIENLSSDVRKFYDAYVEMEGDLSSGEWTGQTWHWEPWVGYSPGWTYFGTGVLPDRDAWLVELSSSSLTSGNVPAGVSASVEYSKVGLGDTTIILYNEFYEEVDTLVMTGVPAVQVTEPNGGESLIPIPGETSPITWDGNVSNVKIEYSSNNGTDWTVIDANTPSDGQYDWTVPQIDSDECLVRISDASDPGVSDTSDELFTIYQCQLVSPANFDSDCQVGVSDLGIFMLNWLGGDSIADIAPPPDGDLEVDLRDFALFSEDWQRNGNPFDPGFTEAP